MGIIRVADNGILVDDISKSYDDLRVLRQINILIKKGSVVSFLGPNGCGKTTLLKIISRYIRPDCGSVYIDGKSIGEARPVELSKKMGTVQQMHKSSFPFSVLDVVLTGRAPYIGAFSTPSANDVEISLETLSSLGISRLAEKPYTTVSGGERQLVMIAKALAQEPEFMLLDEPTTFLDLKNQVSVLKIVTQLAKEKKMTVVMTLHDPNQALMFSDDVVLLGKIMGDNSVFLQSNLIAIGKPSSVMTPDNIKKAYDVDVEIIEHGERNIIIPVIGGNLTGCPKIKVTDNI